MYGGFLGAETTRHPQGDNNQTVLSGEIDLNSSLWSLHVVSSTSGSSILKGFTIKSGFADDSSLLWHGNYGGGLYMNNSGFSVIEDCRFIANKSVSLGGGVYLETGNCRFQDCEFLENSAYNGGGIYNAPSAKSLFYNCRFGSNLSSNRGGASFSYSASSSYLNCQFMDNVSEGRGGAIYGIGGSSLFFDGCIFSSNKAIKHGGGLFCEYTDLILANSIFLNNDAGDGDGGGAYIENTHWSTNKLITNSCFIENKAKDGTDVFSRGRLDITNSIFGEYGYRESSTGGTSSHNILINSTNLFVNIDDPVGPDGVWVTEDDGLRVIPGSPAIDAGDNAALPSDSSDLDGDGNITEPIPYDALRRNRIIGSSVDIGPYEFDPDNPPPVVQKLLSLSTSVGGSITGGGYYDKGVSVTIEPSPSSGYLFGEWSGDASGSTNPLTIAMNADKTITANFIQDLSDDDEDGLSNFDEIITYGTIANDPDSDDDGLLDGLEVEYDTNPLSSDIKVLNLIRDNPSVLSSTTSSGYHDLLRGRDINATPYSPDWFYIPDQGWMWSQKGVYPWFYDANSSNWMYFQSGYENPRFYHYGTKQWMTLE
jgi:predicted outer membrane repeat protein